VLKLASVRTTEGGYHLRGHAARAATPPALPRRPRRRPGRAEFLI